jgi:TRL-like protein family
MMRKVMLTLVAMSALALGGCAIVATPAIGGLYTDVQWPGGATSNVGSSKSGKGECTSILAIVATGDCSVQTIAKSAGISRIHHVDNHTTQIWFVYGKLEVTVYGE